MPHFRYTAVAADGSKVKADIDALSENIARDELLVRNLEVQKIKRARKSLFSVEITKKRVKRAEIMNFSRQMAAFVAAGIPLTDGLQVIAKGSTNRRWQEVLGEASDAITQGTQFSDALARNAELFPPYYLGIIKAAEMTGRLDLALVQVSNYLERDLETRSRINQALAYPMVVLGMAGVTVSVLAVWVLPKFADFFSGLGAKLPLTTRIMIGFANLTSTYWYLYLLNFALFAAFMTYLMKSQRGRRIRNRVSLKLPLIKVIVLYSVVERVTRILGAMSRAGVPLPDAMAAAIKGANNSVFETGLQSAQTRMLEGEGLAGPIGDTGLFPEAAIQMMRVGENTGTLDVQLENASDYYSKELEYKLKKLTTLFEPAVILVMGLVVGFVAIALVQAMYGIYSAPTLTNLK
ncbi:MAG TPA: type II secretion system F family protein [Acidimicrobiia bacterium]|jgi:type IV pilus assembly protein PilC|nr:type II secretion system F family protein [Acidimicrobiia bacterium]